MRRADLDQRRAVFRARLPAAIGWLVVTPLAVSAGARLARFDESSSLLLLADGLTPLLGPPALVAFGIALQQRRRALAVVSAATAGVFSAQPCPESVCPSGSGRLASGRRYCGCSPPTFMTPTPMSAPSPRRS